MPSSVFLGPLAFLQLCWVAWASTCTEVAQASTLLDSLLSILPACPVLTEDQSSGEGSSCVVSREAQISSFLSAMMTTLMTGH